MAMLQDGGHLQIPHNTPGEGTGYGQQNVSFRIVGRGIGQHCSVTIACCHASSVVRGRSTTVLCPRNFACGSAINSNDRCPRWYTTPHSSGIGCGCTCQSTLKASRSDSSVMTRCGMCTEFPQACKTRKQCTTSQLCRDMNGCFVCFRLGCSAGSCSDANLLI